MNLTPHKNFTLLGQGSYEITGRGQPDRDLDTLVSDVVPKPLVSEGLKCVLFGGHQSQTIERKKASYDMYKCILIIF